MPMLATQQPSKLHMGVSHNKGTLNWGPYNKDPTICGTILGSPIFGNPQIGGKSRVCRSAVPVFDGSWYNSIMTFFGFAIRAT